MNTSAPRFSPALLAVIFTIVVLGAFAFYTLSNDFSLVAHADEKKKVVQILDRTRNFNHPLLLLSTTQLLTDRWPGAATPDQVARVGRGVAAAFMAFAVGFLVLLAHRRAGAVAASTAAVLLLAVPMLFELGHFFKEDPALLFGIALTLWLLDRALEKSTLPRWLLVAVGCAIAASGKYLGALLILPIGLFLFYRTRGEKMTRRLGWLTAVLVVFPAAFAVLNLEMMRSLPTAHESVQREISRVREGGAKGKRKVPHNDYLKTLKSNVPVPLLVLALGGVILAFRRGRDARFEQGIFLLALGWLILLSFSPKVAPRYALPVVTLTVWLAASGVAWLWQIRSPGWVRVMTLLLALTGLGLQARPLYRTIEGFATNNRDDLVRWLLVHSRPGDRIAQDDRVALQHQPEFQGRKVLGSKYVADLGTIGQLRAKGVRWVVINDGNLVLFEKRAAQGANDPLFAARRAFYKVLQTENKTALELKESTVSALNPGLLVFDLGE